jgi:hypothetical protein
MTPMGADGKNANAFKPQGHEPRMAQRGLWPQPRIKQEEAEVAEGKAISDV